MKVNSDLIKKVANIARISLSEKEAKEFVPEVDEILKAFRKLDKINTDNVKPSFHPIKIRNITREDKVSKSLTQEQALSNSKNNKDGYIKGPNVV